jgi:hypothetical protein
MPKAFKGKDFAFLIADNVPSKYREELDNILKTAGAINGDKFVEMVKFTMNMSSLVSLMLHSSTPKDDLDSEGFRKTLTFITEQLVLSHAESLGVENMSEVIKTVQALEGILAIMSTEVSRGKL